MTHPNEPTEEQVKRAIATAVDSVPLCGCGSQETMWDVVLAMLERADDHDKRGSFYDPMPEFELSPTAVEWIAQALNQSDLLEHGTGIGWAWLTKTGLALLAFLRRYGTDDKSWPEYAQDGGFVMEIRERRQFTTFGASDPWRTIVVPEGEPRAF